MDLLTVTTSYPTHVDDPRGRFVFEWACALRSLDAKIRIVGPRMPDVVSGFPYFGYRHPKGLLMDSGAPEILQEQPLWGSIRGAAVIVEMTRLARNTIKSTEMLVAHWLVPSVYASLAVGHRLQLPVHGYAHGSDVALLEGLPKAVGRRVAKVADRRAMGITFVSTDLQTRFNSLLGRAPVSEQTVIPMGITSTGIDSSFATALKSMAKGRPVVATVGRMVDIKGLDILRDALAGSTDVLWVAAGDGPFRDELIRSAKEMGVELFAPGEVSPAKRDTLLEIASVFVQPSRRLGQRQEGTPLSVMEAIKAGVPTVLTQTGGMTALGQEAHSIMVPPENPTALYQGIRQILDDPHMRARIVDQHLQVGAKLGWDAIKDAHWAALASSRKRYFGED